LGIIERIVPENGALAPSLRAQLTAAVLKYKALPGDELTEGRYRRFRVIGA
jgi:acetyl-CoA carboxylase alpha subunit